MFKVLNLQVYFTKLLSRLEFIEFNYLKNFAQYIFRIFSRFAPPIIVAFSVYSKHVFFINYIIYYILGKIFNVLLKINFSVWFFDQI